MHVVVVSVLPTKLTLIIKQVMSLKDFTTDYHSIQTLKITIFLTILNHCLDLPQKIPFTGETNSWDL